MAVDKEAISLPRVYSYYSKCNLIIFYIFNSMLYTYLMLYASMELEMSPTMEYYFFASAQNIEYTDHEYDLRMDASSNQSLALVRLCHQQTTGSRSPPKQSNGWRYSLILHQNTCNSRPPENCYMDLQLETRVDDRSYYYYDLRMDDNDNNTAYTYVQCV